MKITHMLALVLFSACGGFVEQPGASETDVGFVIHENVVCDDLILCLCRTCEQTCEMCVSEERIVCDFCVEEARDAGECIELIDACL